MTREEFRQKHYEANKELYDKRRKALGINETGLRRLIAPETSRPFIAKLSAAAGRVARSILSNTKS